MKPFQKSGNTPALQAEAIAGTAGAGYAYPNQMTDEQLERYGERVGRLTAQYGPHIFDTYGYANISVHE